MNTINRALLIAHPKEPFVEWVATQADLSMDEARVELGNARRTYLISPYSLENDLDDILGALCNSVFSCELAAWNEDEACWPAERSLATFKRWFAVELCQQVIDLGEGDVVEHAECGEIGS